MENQLCEDPAGCPPCASLNPDCVGLPDGNNSFPGRPKEYIMCFGERTYAMDVCEFDYNPSKRECGPDMCRKTLADILP